MNATRLSIIIPMYNEERHIRKCLLSCLTQDIPASDYEIIVVDDGSTDGCAGIVEEVASASKVAIRLLRQANSGQGSARNKALEVAEGEWIWFVDADDSICENCLGELLAMASGDVDILAFGMRNVSPEGDLLDEFRYGADLRTSGRQWIRIRNEKLKLCPPTYLWKAGLLNKYSLRFHPDIIVHEDAEFIPRAILFAENIRICSLVPYVRLVHASSTTTTVSTRRPRNLITVLESLKEFEDVNAPGDRGFNSLLANISNYACRLSDQTPEEDRGEFSRMVASLRWLPKTLRGSLQLKYRIEGYILTFLSIPLTSVHRFLMKFKAS